jgi:drug/metabolite transporter (DMT)-like permease
MDRNATIVLALVCSLATAMAQISLKIGVSTSTLQAELAAGQTQTFLIRALLTPWVVVGFALYVTGAVLWLVVLGRADVSYAYPFVSLGFVLTAAYAYFWLHEAITPGRILGIVLISAGVWFVAKS